MKFTEQFGITRQQGEDWFDPLLTVDTRLFIDPFLIYDSEEGVFEGSHEEIIAFFNSVFQLIARSGGSSSSPLWHQAVDLLRFPEVPEVCLGYTGRGTRGSGSGLGLARLIAAGLWEAVRAGVREIRHFEEIGILHEGIGADRISDITANIIRQRLAAYTQVICNARSVPLRDSNSLRGRYDPASARWAPLRVQLPHNPYNQRAVLLVPRHYLRSLPTVNPDDFWDYSYVNDNETLRREYGQDITRNVDKATIVSYARTHPAMREKFIVSLEANPPAPYDFDRDREGLVRWYDAAKQYCTDNPITLSIREPAEFEGALDRMCEEYKQFVHENRGWRLLINDNGTPRHESAAQDLFLGIVLHYCRANNIDISREPDIGRGPVDFKTSLGHQLRALQEVKLAKNTKFWNGLERQLPTYLGAERVDLGYFIVIIQTDNDLRRLSQIQDRIAAAAAKARVRLKYVSVDSRRPPSASNL